MNLKMAIEVHCEAKCLLDKGISHATEKQCIKRDQVTLHNNTFKLVARGCYKLKRPHVAPLSDWALETPEEISALNPNSALLFPVHTKHISDNILSLAIKRLEYAGIATPHGFSSLASSVLN